MDFRHQITSLGTLASLKLDALVLVVTGAAVDPALEPALAALLADAVEHDDLKLKKGKALYVHRPAGVKATRLVFAVAEGTTAKAVKAAKSLMFWKVRAIPSLLTPCTLRPITGTDGPADGANMIEPSWGR